MQLCMLAPRTANGLSGCARANDQSLRPLPHPFARGNSYWNDRIGKMDAAVAAFGATALPFLTTGHARPQAGHRHPQRSFGWTIRHSVSGQPSHLPSLLKPV
jgi:hypothetical protein